MRLVFVLIAGVVFGLMFASGGPSGMLQALHTDYPHWLPLGLRATALVAFGLTVSVLVLFALVSEGGYRKGELSTVVPSFFAFYAFSSA